MNEAIGGGYGEWGAGDDWNFDDEDGGEINSYDSDGLERYELPFRELDEFSKITNDSKYGLVGVMADVKKATEFSLVGKKDEMDLEEYFVEGILDDLGLKYVKESRAVVDDDIEDSNDPARDYVDIRYCVAKTDDVARLVHELFGKIGDDGEAGLDAMRRLGELFGFPETAIDYYIQMEKDGHTYKANKEKKYHSYIHSEEHGEEEYEQYEGRINGLFKKYCPQSAMEFLDESE